MRIGVPGAFVAVSTGVTVSRPPRYAVFPSRVNANASTRELRRIGFPGLLVATLIGVTVSEGKKLVTYAVFPSGFITISPAPPGPMPIGVPGRLVAVLIGTTVSPVPTYRVFPFGVSAIPPLMLTWIGLPGLLVAVLIGIIAVVANFGGYR